MLLRSVPRLRALAPALRSVRFTSSTPLIHIQNGTFYRQYPTGDDITTNPPLFPNFSFSIASKAPATDSKKEALQHWAVVGTSGRTDLLDILRGQHICLPADARSYPYLRTEELAAKDPQLRYVDNAIQYIGFRGEGSGAIGGTRGAYLSARYESLREETDWTVEQFLRGQTDLNPIEGEENGVVRDEKLLHDVVTDLHLTELLGMPVANLSNGQTRRARIAKALLRKPELLLLDEPFMGLDPATVRSISNLLHRLAEKSSPRLILALRPQDTVPQWISHVMVVGNAHHVAEQGSRAEVDSSLAIWKRLADGNAVASSLDKRGKEILKRAKQDLKSGILDMQLVHDLTTHEVEKPSKVFNALPEGEPLIEMDGVRVQYGDKAVLGDWRQLVDGETKDGLHWRVRRGQRWAILGANGSGKTTLLSLITSDHPQTYALPIKLFGRSRLPEVGTPGISIFELQSRLGHSSPEIHAFFPRQLTIRAAVESAFAETFLSKPKLDYERDLDVSAALRFFKAELDPNAGMEQELSSFSSTNKMFPDLQPENEPKPKPTMPMDFDIDYADNLTFGQLTTAQQRIVLFIRALINRPDIVILDEPFSGLSASQRDKCLEYIDHGDVSSLKMFDRAESRFQGLSEKQALVLISHVKEEIPNSIRHYMRLPSESDDSAESLDLRFGLLKPTSVLSDPKVWDSAWSPALSQSSDESIPDGQQTGADRNVYEWCSI